MTLAPSEHAPSCPVNLRARQTFWGVRPAELTPGVCNCTDALPRCVLAMQCYCAGHARGNDAGAPCDTSEQPTAPDDGEPGICPECRNPVRLTGQHIADGSILGTCGHAFTRAAWNIWNDTRTMLERTLDADVNRDDIEPESILSALERAIRDVCDEDTQNAISDRYRELTGESDGDSDDDGEIDGGQS